MDKDTFYCYEIVKDRYGKKHKVYSVMIKDRLTVARYLEKYIPDLLFPRMMELKYDQDGIVELDQDGLPMYNDGSADDLIEIIELALDHRETREEIMQWLDLDTVNEIINTFVRLSQFKKKAMEI